ncbi:MAG: ClpXP protease specificity-enhancing factor [Candidatus Accumulibacter sp.]|jgi:stringent starvation protein B|nr:ClpXP protease specificity-enhancing factor [Accumulibacter sp.]
MEAPSLKPYFLRAIHDWCTDNDLTPHISVVADGDARVPPEYVRDGRITLNIAFDATGELRLDNDEVSFKARFGGVARDIRVPIGKIAAIYARENGVGMSFEVEKNEAAPETDPHPAPTDAPKPGRAHLHRVK